MVWLLKIDEGRKKENLKIHAVYNIFGPMKEGLRDKHASDEVVKTAVMKLLKEQSKEFY